MLIGLNEYPNMSRRSSPMRLCSPLSFNRQEEQPLPDAESCHLNGGFVEALTVR